MTYARVLVVEDESIVSKDIQNTLRGLGYSVSGTANSGELAIEKARELSPDLILMDIRLKGEVDGISAAEQIQTESSVPIIYLTAHGDARTIERAKITEPFGYIMKPFAEHDLHTTIEMALYRHKMEKRLIESERKFKDLYHNAPDGYLTIDAAGVVQNANSTFLHMVGAQENEVMHGSLGRFVAESSGETYSRLIDNLNKKKPINNKTLEIKTKDNKILPVLINCNVALNDKGNLVSSSCILRDVSDIFKLEREKESLTEKVIQLTRKIPLNDNEKRVFEGIVSFPEYNDIQLSKLLKIKRSTVTAIKNKLKREHYFASHKIPHFPSIGCEMAIAVSFRLNPTAKLQKEVASLIEDINQVPESVYLIASGNNLLCIQMTKNLTEFKKQMDSLIASYKTNDVIAQSKVHYFPFETSQIPKFLNFSRYLSLLFELEPQPGSKKPKPKIESFTKKEKQIFYALVKYGDLNDSEIAAQTGLARPSISQVRRKLIERGSITEANVPDPLKLRSELAVQNHVTFDFDDKQKMESIRKHIESDPSTYLMLAGDAEIISLHLYNDYSSFQTEHNNLMTLFNEHSISYDNFESTLYPVTQLKKHLIQFDPLVKKSLGLSTSI